MAPPTPPEPDVGPLLEAAEYVSARPPAEACAPVHIVVLGSSTAAGFGPGDSGNAWVERYRRHLESAGAGHRLTNLARGGFNTYRLLPSPLGGAAAALQPDTAFNIERALAAEADAIIVNLPSNDANLGIPVRAQLANYDTLVARARAADVPVWITTTQPRDFDATKRANALAVRDETIDRFGTRAIDFFSGLGRPDGTISSPFANGDGIHLNDAAHAVLFARVADAGIPAAVSCEARADATPANTDGSLND